MTKQSVILTKWVIDSDIQLNYSQLILLMFKNIWDFELGIELKEVDTINQMIANSDVGTKWKLTLEKVEDANT
jgi:hypothetical protein